MATRSAIGPGGAVYATALAALGVLLVSRELVYVWAPIPASVPGRDGLACAAGGVMLMLAIGLVWRKTVVRASASLAVLFLGWLLLLHVPRIVGAPGAELLWSGAGQLAAIVAAAWIVFASHAAAGGRGRWFRGSRGLRLARTLYAVALLLFGLHHFLAAGASAAVPAWLPFRLGWAYVTGAAHIAAGLAILVGIVPRLAATLEAIMISAFVLLVHVPGVIGAPAVPLQWTMLVVASVLGGAAWVVAGSYGPPQRA